MSPDGDRRHRHHHRAAGVDGLFSHFLLDYDCGSHRRHYRMAIEPLVGGLRHPLFGCDRRKLLDKSYMLLASAYDVPHFHGVNRGKAYVFDLGASVYNAGS